MLLRRVADWFEQHAIPPEKAARQIIAAVEKGKPRLRITPEAVFADWLKRCLPVLGNRLVCDLAIRSLGLGDMREKRRRQWQKTMVDGDTED